MQTEHNRQGDGASVLTDREGCPLIIEGKENPAFSLSTAGAKGVPFVPSPAEADAAAARPAAARVDKVSSGHVTAGAKTAALRVAAAGLEEPLPRFLDTLTKLDTGNGSCVALGYFDGVHLGHRLVLARAVQEARARGCAAAVFTFAPPANGSVKGKAILTPAEKLRRMASLGIEAVLCPPFEAFCALSPEEFVETVLIECLGAKAVFCGENFTFGRGRAGNADTLRSLCAARGIAVETLPLMECGGAPVSSSRIRALLAGGGIPAANALLGEAYCIDLPVRHGKRLGRTLGFPTINQVYPEGMLLPRQGVYVTRVLLNGQWLPGATGLGTRPSVAGGGTGAGVTCETFIPDFAGELYDSAVRVRFCKFLWPTQKYDSLEALTAMVNRAADAARAWE